MASHNDPPTPVETQHPDLDREMTPRVKSVVGNKYGPMFTSGEHSSNDDSFLSDTKDPQEECKSIPLNPDQEAMTQYLASTSFTRDKVKRIGRCDGSRPGETLKWLRAIDQCTTDRYTVIAETCEGPLREFVVEKTIPLHSHPWPELKKLIAEQFISADFTGHQQRALREMRQRPDEHILAFTYQFSQTMNEAYPNGISQEESIRLYLGALSDRSVARAIVKKAGGLPATFAEAADLAKEEASIADYLTPCTVLPTPKKPPVASIQLNDQVQIMRQCFAELQTGLVEALQPLSCYRCGEKGHFANECRSKTTPKQAGIDKCFRCRQTGHVVRNCKTPPPNKPCPTCSGKHWAFDCPKRQRKASAPAQPLN
ncbi:hypothetical protein CAPTEDRAFT_211795 [Capitella teleta]|uniref:CCHC-type domain-containing protein n=1 Tax=Capitella teleta TaxID=283909 RepID=R7T4L8_CAPTE|nr:hypothetical protein CAPTEDRAFT_211795 [Capitella teleta]|eukprot:ELT87771.1 hypothetical protein CAPTEDRAFT_211795 [Capitella teleta]